MATSLTWPKEGYYRMLKPTVTRLHRNKFYIIGAMVCDGSMVTKRVNEIKDLWRARESVVSEIRTRHPGIKSVIEQEN